MERHQKIVDLFLWPIWMGMSSDRKRKYARNIWEQMEASIRYGGRSENLRRCFERLRRRLDLAIRADHFRLVEEFLSAGDDAAALKTMREEAAYLTILLRLRNEERKQLNNQQQQDDEGEQKENDQLSI